MKPNQNWLLVFIIGDDCTNGGATGGGRKTALIPHPEGPYSSAQAAESGHPLLEIDEFPIDRYQRQIGKANLKGVFPVLLVCRPAGKNPGMFGGNYIVTSDARFPYSAPVAVFDRYEQA